MYKISTKFTFFWVKFSISLYIFDSPTNITELSVSVFVLELKVFLSDMLTWKREMMVGKELILWLYYLFYNILGEYFFILEKFKLL